MKITIEIDESTIKECVKNYIDSNKEKIIERVIDRATEEIVIKGLPKVIENFSDKEEK